MVKRKNTSAKFIFLSIAAILIFSHNMMLFASDNENVPEKRSKSIAATADLVAPHIESYMIVTDDTTGERERIDLEAKVTEAAPTEDGAIVSVTSVLTD